ncbi:MAG: NAD-dependent epimerase/dehydratase family protein [Burkholderiales bacterium]
MAAERHFAVIGGSGLIGGATAARLIAAGSRVTILSRQRPAAFPPGGAWVQADITDAAGLAAALGAQTYDGVLHLAAYLQFACEKDPVQAVRVNVDGTLNVLEACRTLGIRRCVFASSIAAYGERHDLMHEDDPPAASIGLYGMTKRLGEMLGARYAALHGLEFVALRYAGVYGPGKVHSPGMALVRQLIKDTAQGIDVTVEGASGDEGVHLTHVEDAAEATCRALLHPAPGHHVYNVGGPPQCHVPLREFHAAVKKLVPGAGKVTWQGRGRSSGPVDLTRLREDLGFTPSVSLEAGLAADLGLKLP